MMILAWVHSLLTVAAVYMGEIEEKRKIELNKRMKWLMKREKKRRKIGRTNYKEIKMKSNERFPPTAGR